MKSTIKTFAFLSLLLLVSCGGSSGSGDVGGDQNTTQEDTQVANSGGDEQRPSRCPKDEDDEDLDFLKTELDRIKLDLASLKTNTEFMMGVRIAESLEKWPKSLKNKVLEEEEIQQSLQSYFLGFSEKQETLESFCLKGN